MTNPKKSRKKNRFEAVVSRERDSRDCDLLLFVDGGLVLAFGEDAAAVSETLGLMCYWPTTGLHESQKTVSFPLCVLDRNLDALGRRGRRVAVCRTVSFVLGNNVRVSQNEPHWEPDRKSIRKATVEILSSLTPEQRSSRGYSGPPPVECREYVIQRRGLRRFVSIR